MTPTSLLASPHVSLDPRPDVRAGLLSRRTFRTFEHRPVPAALRRWVCYPEGNHVCNNIIYEYRPLVADVMAEHLA